MRSATSVVLLILIGLPANASPQARPKHRNASPNTSSRVSNDEEAEKARAAIREMTEMLEEGLLAGRYDAPLTAELMAVSRTASGKVTDVIPINSSMYADFQIKGHPTIEWVDGLWK